MMGMDVDTKEPPEEDESEDGEEEVDTAKTKKKGNKIRKIIARLDQHEAQVATLHSRQEKQSALTELLQKQVFGLQQNESRSKIMLSGDVGDATEADILDWCAQAFPNATYSENIVWFGRSAVIELHQGSMRTQFLRAWKLSKPSGWNQAPVYARPLHSGLARLWMPLLECGKQIMSYELQYEEQDMILNSQTLTVHNKSGQG